MRLLKEEYCYFLFGIYILFDVEMSKFAFDYVSGSYSRSVSWRSDYLEMSILNKFFFLFSIECVQQSKVIAKMSITSMLLILDSLMKEKAKSLKLGNTYKI